ncbi:IS701 family transposase [Nocardiopsis gilva]|uniref:IS701 family transposase n=1 Tax=Nocardiopsis gilva TaxID=280236 RepID=UPI0003477DAF|nr:IS701 family transposase [Nocardiopsis gilva]
MKTTKKQAAAAATSVAALRWPHLPNELISTVPDPHLARPATRATACDILRALLAPLTRKNCRALSEHAGHPSPYRMQHLLTRARLDEAAVRACLRGYLITCLGSKDVVLVVDETGDSKKGSSTVGVARQYTGTTGKIDNCQVAVYLAYTTPGTHALIDHCVYLPRASGEDHARLQAAGVPAEVAFATKPELAREMIAAALEHAPAAWVAGGEVYGRTPALREYLEEHRVGYVMAIAATDRIPVPRGPVTMKELAVLLPRAAWQKRSAGAGAKGQRYYAWALIGDRVGSDGVRWVPRSPSPAGLGGADHVDLQRDRPSAARPVPSPLQRRARPGLVGVQTLPPSTGPALPLP